jgi:hypothetical protein
MAIYKYRKISHVFPSLTLEEGEYPCKPRCVDPFDSSDEKYDPISNNEELIEDEARFYEADKEKTSKTESVSIPTSSFSPSSYTTASSITIIEKQGPLEEEEDITMEGVEEEEEGEITIQGEEKEEGEI